MDTNITLIPNTDFVAISPRISTRRVTGLVRYPKRDGSYIDYDHNQTGMHNFKGVYRMLAKAEQQGLFTTALETNARSVCRVNAETTVSYDPNTGIARVGWTERGGRGHKYEAVIDIVR